MSETTTEKRTPTQSEIIEQMVHQEPNSAFAGPVTPLTPNMRRVLEERAKNNKSFWGID